MTDWPDQWARSEGAAPSDHRRACEQQHGLALWRWSSGCEQARLPRKRYMRQLPLMETRLRGAPVDAFSRGATADPCRAVSNSRIVWYTTCETYAGLLTPVTSPSQPCRVLGQPGTHTFSPSCKAGIRQADHWAPIAGQPCKPQAERGLARHLLGAP